MRYFRHAREPCAASRTVEDVTPSRDSCTALVVVRTSMSYIVDVYCMSRQCVSSVRVYSVTLLFHFYILII